MAGERKAGSIEETAALYDRISKDFTRLRGKNPWAPLVSFLDDPAASRSLDCCKDGIVVDAGCGNGRNARALLRGPAARYVGVDLSTSLASEARAALATDRRVSVIAASATRLPLREARASCVAMVAVLHHLPSVAAMREALGMARHVLDHRCVIVVSTWRKWQRRFVKALLKNVLSCRRPAGLVNVPWIDGKTREPLARWYHLLPRRSLVALIRENFNLVNVRALGGPGGKDNWFVAATVQHEPEGKKGRAITPARGGTRGGRGRKG